MSYDVPDPYNPQPGQTWRPTRYATNNPARHITAVVPNESAKIRTRKFRVYYRNVLPKHLGRERSCWLGQFEDWVMLHQVVSSDLPDLPPSRPPSRAALGRAVIEAARRYTNAVTGDPRWEYMRALVDAVRAYDEAGGGEQQGKDDAR